MAITKGGGAGKTAAPLQSKLGAGIASAVGGAPAPIAGSGGVSLDPSTFTAGAFLDDVDVVISDAQFLLWDYDGHVAEESPALGITYHVIDQHGNKTDEKDHDQYYSCGKKEDFVPSPDGAYLVPVGSKTGINNNTNIALLIANMLNVGVPVSLIASGNCKQMIGMRLHVNQIPAPERSGLPAKDPTKKKTVLVPTKLIALPGEAASGGGKVAVNPAPAQTQPVAQVAQAAAAAGDDALDQLTADTIVALIAKNGGTLERKKCASGVFMALKGNPSQKAAMQKAGDEAFLTMGMEGGFWMYDGATLVATE